MPEETSAPAPSATAVETSTTVEQPQSYQIPRSGTPEYESWRKDGTLPTPKSEDTASSSETEDEESEVESADATEASLKQEKADKGRPHLTAKQRVDQLRATAEAIAKKAGFELSWQAESSSAKVSPKSQPTYEAPKPEYTRPKPTAEDKKEDGSLKFDSYEDYIEELADWKVEQREATNKRETAMREQAAALNLKVNEAKARYADFADKVSPFVDDFVSDPSISPLVKRMVDDSEVFADLAYVLSGDAKFKEVAQNPGKAIRYIANVERLIAEELAGKADSARNDKGQFEAKVETPVKRGPESAPKPPIEIGQRGTSTMDEAERALQEIGRGNSAKATRAWLDAENRKEIARRRGA